MDGDQLVVIADLHMSEGRDGAEHFHEDIALARLVEDLGLGALAEGRRCRLLILGDLFDFPKVGASSNGAFPARLDRSTDASVAKLERIAAAHPSVFEALGKFVASGLSLDLVPGNHDVELMRGPVRDRFKSLIARAAGSPSAEGDVRLHPWIVRVPGVLYAEHGQQYHDLNRFADLVTPFTDQDAQIALPPGAMLDELLVEVAQAGARTAPARRFLRRLALSATEMERAQRPSRRAAYHERLRRHAAELELGPDLLVAIESLSAATPRSMAGRLLRRAMLGPAMQRVRPKAEALRADGYMLAAARRIHEVLASAGRASPFYVFGHTHIPADEPLTAESGGPRYLNPGTWSSLTRGPTDGLRYLEFSGEPGAIAPTARLRRWEPGAARAESPGL
jgi:UDP-2,3-diacylglucosamine pyrophosphatase LpxH